MLEKLDGWALLVNGSLLVLDGIDRTVGRVFICLSCDEQLKNGTVPRLALCASKRFFESFDEAEAP